MQLSINPHVAAERWDFDRLVCNAGSNDSNTVEAVLDQFRLRAHQWSPYQKARALELAQQVLLSPPDVTVAAAARDFIAALGRG